MVNLEDKYFKPVIIHMAETIYKGHYDHLMKDWLLYFEEIEAFENCIEMKQAMDKDGIDTDLSNHTPLVNDMMSLYDVCKEAVAMNWYGQGKIDSDEFFNIVDKFDEEL